VSVFHGTHYTRLNLVPSFFSSTTLTLTFCHSEAVPLVCNTLPTPRNSYQWRHLSVLQYRLAQCCSRTKRHTTVSSHGPTAPSRARPPYCRAFMIVLRHTTVGRTPLDEWSARRRDLYLTTHNTHRQTLPRQDSNPQFPQVSDHRPTAQATRPPRWADTAAQHCTV
jgi:hypothetical protein